jgi:hypothetical protein
MKMKKVAYLSVLMLSLVLMSTSCCKDEDENPLPNVITTADLVGDWNFVSLNYTPSNFCTDGIYNTENELVQLDVTFNYIQLSFIDVTTSTLGLLDHRGSGIPAPDNYVLSNNQINFRDGFLVFSIENWETFDGSVLKLKLLSSNSSASTKPIGGIYTLTYSN